MVTKKQIKSYVTDKVHWAATTAKTTTYRLNSVRSAIDYKPLTLLRFMKAAKWSKYSQLKAFNAVTNMVQWEIENGEEKENPYKAYLRANPKTFANAYTRRPATTTMATATSLIGTITDPAARDKAFQILYSGMRWGESKTYKDGWCAGKTGSRQVVVLPQYQNVHYPYTYETFRQALNEVGLTPHQLRKIFLTHMAMEVGVNVFQLQKLAGWKSLNSATAYVACHNKDMVKIMDKFHKGLSKSCQTQELAEPLKRLGTN
jgi:site-specific recombinase XerD